ncbi:MAG: helix-turn-helix domain-containing protein [Candidatus Rokubacteria bacterium]|nr:helix-turn-helix domain-containing protein [Candidatus Rokubacteria bacterium]
MVTRCEVKPPELRRIRAEMGLTQTELAEALGVHRVTVARWETGERGIPEPVARLLQRIRSEKKRKT